MNKSKFMVTTIALTSVLILGGCSNMSRTQQRALSGAGIGALGGAAVGGITGGSSGALIGAGVGAAAGGAIGAATSK